MQFVDGAQGSHSHGDSFEGPQKPPLGPHCISIGGRLWRPTPLGSTWHESSGCTPYTHSLPAGWPPGWQRMNPPAQGGEGE